jgi:hypothetical protein
MIKLKGWLFEGIVTRAPVKLLGGLAAGAFILTGTTLYFGPTQFHDEHSPMGVDSVFPNTDYYLDPD